MFWRMGSHDLKGGRMRETIHMGSQKGFTSGIMPPAERREPAWWFAFQRNNLLVRMSRVSLPYAVDFEEVGLAPLCRHYLGSLDGRTCFAVEVAEEVESPSGMAFEGLRQVHGRLDEDLFWMAARAVQIVEWDRTHQFCGRCGVRMNARPTERAKECPQCGLLHFPRLAPAIIVLIERGDQLLLARSQRFATGMYSVLAGFVEPGESLEEAVVREIKEEVGLSVREIRYFGSQPWPFPHSLMIGFTAMYAGGEISIDESEIEVAGWFTVDTLPPLPGKISIARKLIDAFIAKHRSEAELSGSRG
jgi:NAD+ diphosphatase